MKIKEISFLDALSEIVDNRGKTAPTADIGIPLIATNCISNQNLYPEFKDVRYVDESTYQNWFRGHPQPNDIIFVNKGSPGRVCLVPDPVNFVIAQDMVSLRVNPEITTPDFLLALLRSDEVQNQIANMHVGTLIPHFKKGDFQNLILKFPDLEIQRAIGSIYRSFSDKIELNRRMNRTLEALARALFKSWFVDFDPVRAKMRGEQPEGMDEETAALFPDELVEVDGREVPRGWEVGSFGDLAQINRAVLKKSDDLEQISYIEISAVAKGEISEIAKYTRGEEPSRAKRRLAHGDTVLSTVRPDRQAYFLALNPDESLIASTGFAVVSPNRQSDWPLVYSGLTQDEVFSALGQLADGGAYPAVNPEVIGALPLTYPSDLRLLDAFSNFIAPLLLHSDGVRLESARLASLRDSLLPRLLAGEIDVSEWETENL